MQSKDFNAAIASMPLITVLRGIQEKEVDDVAKVLIESGITVFEVPLRTKNPPPLAAATSREFVFRYLMNLRICSFVQVI